MIYPVDNIIHRINLYPVDHAIGFSNTHPLDSDLSGRYIIHRINLYPVDNTIGFPDTYPLDSELSNLGQKRLKPWPILFIYFYFFAGTLIHQFGTTQMSNSLKFSECRDHHEQEQ